MARPDQRRRRLAGCWKIIKKDLLLILTVIGVILGTFFGFLVRMSDPSETTIYVIGFPGEMMLRILKMLILPLITLSLISGVTALDTEASGKLGSRALLYYLSTTVFAAILGIILVFIIHPGDPLVLDKDAFDKEAKTIDITTMDALFDLIRNLFPDNIIQACFEMAKTKFEYVDVVVLKAVEDGSSTVDINNTIFENETLYENVTKSVRSARTLTYSNGMNVLGLIMFCLCFGIMITKVKDKAAGLIDLINVTNEIVMRLVLFFMWYSPVGIMFLIMQNILLIDDLAGTARILGLYMLTVLCGLALHTLITLCGIYFLFVRKNPFIFIKNMATALMTALGTASSTSTLPLTFKCMEENNGVDQRVTHFVLPIGATVNMDGTALYEGVAAIFIAQMNNYSLDPAQVITICITAIAASVGAASIPSAGLVTMILVFTAVGLPVEQISLIISVDWFLDRFRTMVNVLGDSFGAAIVAHLCRDELEKLGPNKHVMGMDDGTTPEEEEDSPESMELMGTQNDNHPNEKNDV